MCLKEYYIIELSYQNSEIALRYANPLCTGRARPIDFFAPEFLWEASKKCSAFASYGATCNPRDVRSAVSQSVSRPETRDLYL